MDQFAAFQCWLLKASRTVGLAAGLSLCSVYLPSMSICISGAEFFLSLLSIAKLFDFTQELQKEILEQ